MKRLPLGIHTFRRIIEGGYLYVDKTRLRHLLAEASSSPAEQAGLLARRLAESIHRDDLSGFFSLLRSLFASIPYDAFVSDREGYYQTVVYLALALMGVDVKTEVETNIGRVDAVIETQTRVYVIEFKLGTAEEALQQIRERRYHERFLHSGKQVQLVGVGFNPQLRNIGSHATEPAP
ncbi:MAG: PD-(D/E)XK nuclease domain-containing protein [Acidobacteriota bacterium]